MNTGVELPFICCKCHSVSTDNSSTPVLTSTMIDHCRPPMPRLNMSDIIVIEDDDDVNPPDADDDDDDCPPLQFNVDSDNDVEVSPPDANDDYDYLSDDDDSPPVQFNVDSDNDVEVRSAHQIRTTTTTTTTTYRMLTWTHLTQRRTKLFKRYIVRTLYLDSVGNRFVMNMFRTSNTEIVRNCQSYFTFKLPTELWSRYAFFIFFN